MFQVEPILWLQSFESPALTWFFGAVTLLGYMPVYMGLIIVLAFGVKLRPGLSVLLALLLASLVTGTLKTWAALPRPGDIDSRVSQPGHAAPVPVVERGGATSFWSPPDPEAVAAIRSRPDASFGFPSGHVSAAAAFMIALVVYFRTGAALGLGLIWVPLIALSRIYLGRHFLADVVGGVIVGALGAALAAILVRPVAANVGDRAPVTRFLPLASLALVLLVAAPFVPSIDAESAGTIIGLVLVYVCAAPGWLPDDVGTPGRRIGRVLLGGCLYLVTYQIIQAILKLTGFEDSRLGVLSGAMVLIAATLGGTITLARRLRLYVPA